MRLRRSAIAATSLGLAGALLPASGAAAEPDRHREYSEEVTFQDPSGNTETCTVFARLHWSLPDDGPRTLSATTEIFCNEPPSFPSDLKAGVTLGWTNHDFRRSQTYRYSAEGDVEVTVSGQATPLDPNTHFGANEVSSEHHAEFVDCVSNCEWSRTLTFPK